jgi:hypothetical protein
MGGSSTFSLNIIFLILKNNKNPAKGTRRYKAIGIIIIEIPPNEKRIKD